MQRILAFSGKKQSGKDSACNFVHGYVLRAAGLYDRFTLDSKTGKLLVPGLVEDNGEVREEFGILDLDRRDEIFETVASVKIWPYVKAYSFADELKDIAIRVFGLKFEHCYGTDEQKNQPCDIKWANIAKLLPPAKVGALKKENKLDTFMTGREFLQVFGTDICREIYGDCWINACFARIEDEGSPIAIIRDVRFPNEADGCKKRGAKLIRFSRNLYHDTHISETALDGYTDYDALIKNDNMTLQEKTDILYRTLLGWGYINAM